MVITFHQAGRMLSAAFREEAKRCVTLYGLGGKGDPEAAAHIYACSANYVLTCVDRELLAFPNNTLAKELRQHLQSAMQ